MSFARKPLIRTAVWISAVAGTVGLVAAPAGAARPRNGSTPASCDVENENGTTSQVPEGTRVGLFYCGSDGEWHFGTVILDWSKVQVAPTTPTKPITGVVATRSATLAR